MFSIANFKENNSTNLNRKTIHTKANIAHLTNFFFGRLLNQGRATISIQAGPFPTSAESVLVSFPV